MIQVAEFTNSYDFEVNLGALMQHQTEAEAIMAITEAALNNPNDK